MNIVRKLTVRHLLLNKNRTLITILGIMLSVAMVCAVAGFVLSLRDMMIRALIDSGKDYHIGYLGVTPRTAEDIAAEPVFSVGYTSSEHNGELVNLYVRFVNPNRNYWDIASEIGAKYEFQGMTANSELLALEGVIAQDNIMMTFIWIATIAIVIIVAGSVIVIANAFHISSMERVRQFGLLKSVGATKSQIGRCILFESFVLALVAIPLGIVLGFLIQSSVLLVTNDLLRDISALNNDALHFRTVYNPIIVYVSVSVATITLLISAWIPARRAANTTPIDAIRQIKDIRIRGRKLKTLRLTGILFGFEGTLAAKSLKRSRGKYRATVVSLTVSIVLFISISSLIEAMNKGVEMEYGTMDYDVIIVAELNWDETAEFESMLSEISDAEVKIFRDLYDENKMYSYYTVAVADSEAYCKAAENLFLTDEREIIIQDVAQMSRLNRNLVNIIRLFGYGFIAMLSLIAVTSVISTISTSMALRRQEFAMLYSSGMTPAGLNKMLNLESLLYGFKSLGIGLPIGIGLSLLIQKVVSAAFVFDYQPPLPAVFISIAAVLLLTFATMRYSIRNMNRMSIVDTLRSDLI